MKINNTSITLENVITIPNYIEALRKCKKSVGYKYSIQYYTSRALHNIADTVNIIRNGQIPLVRNTEKIVIHERGHKRVITPINIRDRITQRVLCDKALIPLLESRLIYDNGASVKGKGTDFSRRRLNQHLETAKRRWGSDNIWILKFDFKSYFDSISHTQCFRVLDELFEDKRLRDLTIGIIESYQLTEILRIKDKKTRKAELKSLLNHEKTGICLGSQISQIMALAVPNRFDHYIKDKLGLKFYVRHMDDGVIILNDKAELQRIRGLLETEAGKYGLRFNQKKTQITKFTKGFTFLKVRYRAAGEKTVKTLDRSGIVRMRRKLKKFRSLKMTTDDVYASVQSWINHAQIASSYKTIKSMMQLYNDLYGGYQITRTYWDNNKTMRRRKKVLRL